MFCASGTKREQAKTRGNTFKLLNAPELYHGRLVAVNSKNRMGMKINFSLGTLFSLQCLAADPIYNA
jgi:hypothetical protein